MLPMSERKQPTRKIGDAGELIVTDALDD